MATPRFIGIAFSPWTIKAKWALDHHGIPYRYVRYLPLVGEIGLRLRTGRWSGRVSVPVLLTDEGPVEGSWEIARYAERHGSRAPLIPAGREAEVAAWNERSEAMLEAGRALTMARMRRSPAALAEEAGHALSPALLELRALRPLLRWAGKLGVRYLVRKYAADGDAGAYEATLRSGHAALRDALDGAEHVLGAFSYADIAMAVSLAQPLGPGLDHLGEASRECWTDSALAAEFADVVAWRDRLVGARLNAGAADAAA